MRGDKECPSSGVCFLFLVFVVVVVVVFLLLLLLLWWWWVFVLGSNMILFLHIAASHMAHVVFFGVCILYIVSCHNYMYYVCKT